MSQPYCLAGTPIVEDLWAAQSGRCAICATPMLRNRFEAAHARIWQKQRATLDHIIPRSKGGADTLENLQLAHARCNKNKGNRL